METNLTRGNKTTSKLADVRLAVVSLVSVTLAVVLLLTWAAVAFAQTSYDGQYGDPTASGETAILSSGEEGPSSGGGSAAEDPASGRDSGVASAASDPANGVIPFTGLLPETGGPVLPLLAFGILALGSGGLLVLRRLNL